MKSSIWKKFTSLLLVTALLFGLTSIPVLATEESADSETAISTGGETGEPSGETGEPGDETGEPGDETGEPGDETGEPGGETGEQPGGEKLQAILDCDEFKDGENGDKLYGMDIYINAQTELIQKETVQNGTVVPGTLQITGTKTWDHTGNPADSKPTSKNLTLILFKKVNNSWAEVKDSQNQNKSLAPTWNVDNTTYTFTVPYESHDTQYKVEEAAVHNYKTSFSGTEAYRTSVGPLTEEKNCAAKTYGSYNANFVVAKLTQNDGFMIWTARPVDQSEEAALRTAAEIAYPEIKNTNKTVTFVSGTSMNYEVPSKGTVTVTYNGQVTITFASTAVWASFAYGTMKTTYTPENGNFKNTYSSEDNQPDRGFFDVKKVDADDNTKTLAGAIFKLVKNDGERTFVAEKQTNGSGIATFDNLEDGKYTLTEEYAPADYQKVEKKWTVTVEQGIVTITEKNADDPLLVKNTKKPAHLTVTKTVIGNQATPGQMFDFTVTLENLQIDAVRVAQLDGDESATDPLPKPADGTWSTNKGKNGTWSFEEGYTAVISVLLVDGETLTVNGLTPEMSYSVKETLLSGYTTNATLNGQPVALTNGEMPQGKIGDAQTESIQNPVVIFTNDAGNRTPRNPRPDRDDPISIPDPAVPLSPDPDVEIPEIDVPLGEAPEEDATVPMDAKPEEEVEISELSIPLGDMNTPQTGDNSNTALFALMAALSAIGLGALVFGKRNRNKG